MKQFYTYVWLREDGSPWYVGKGFGNRACQRCKGHWAPKDRSLIKLQNWADEPTALAYEFYQIDFWGRKNIGTGVLHNLTEGGEGTSGCVLSEETKRKMSVARIGNKSRLGIPHSEEFKKKHSEDMKGKKNPNFGGVSQTAETRAKMSKAKLGRKLSEETKSRMSKVRLGRKFTEEHKKNLSISLKAAFNKKKTQENLEWKQELGTGLLVDVQQVHSLPGPVAT